MAKMVFGGEEVVSELFYGSPARRVVDRLRDLSERTTGFLSDAGRRFTEKYERFRERDDIRHAKRVAQALRERVSHYWQEDTIRPLRRVEDVQNAPSIMRRWVMVNPTVRRRYREGILDGYKGEFFDIDPNVTDITRHYDYRELMHGMPQGEDGNEYHYYSTNAFYEDEQDDDHDDRLTFDEKLAILRTWDVCEIGLDAGRDVTSLWDASI